jgi:hypothetical protein
MSEQRDYIANNKPKPTRADPSGIDLDKLENDQDKWRKDKRMQKKRAIED